jgi:hypothetical protein
LAEAADLYRDRFLADIAIAEEAWSEWADAERERLEGPALDAMVGLGDRELELGDHARALAAARRAACARRRCGESNRPGLRG